MTRNSFCDAVSSVIAGTVIHYKYIQTYTLNMPIDLRKHDPDNPITIRPETNKAKIIKLLYQDTNLGFTPAEIREELDLPRGTVSGTLSRLHDGVLIGKTSNGLYHGLDHREDLCRFAQCLVSLDTRKPGSIRTMSSKPVRVRRQRSRTIACRNRIHRARNPRPKNGSQLKATRRNTRLPFHIQAQSFFRFVLPMRAALSCRSLWIQ